MQTKDRAHYTGQRLRMALRGIQGALPGYDLSEWEKGLQAGAQLQITVPYSKDNIVFAVRAYDAEGHRCLLVYPTRER